MTMDGWGVNNPLAPISIHPDNSNPSRLLSKPYERICNHRRSRFRISRTHNSKIHLQFACAPRSTDQPTQGLIENTKVDIIL